MAPKLLGGQAPPHSGGFSQTCPALRGSRVTNHQSRVSSVGYNAHVIVLAIDTCDLRGSVALLRDEAALALLAHDSSEEYSSWLLPAVSRVLGEAGLQMGDVAAYSVAAGPGSFTGVRVGLTTVKAWAEVYGKPVAAVSRLEAIAAQATEAARAVAAFVDAHRGQLFGAIYRKEESILVRIDDEMVIAPEKFVETAVGLVGGERISWVSSDADVLARAAAWKEWEKRGERIEQVSATLAPIIGRIGLRHVREGDRKSVV